jgi:hypothetical protein
LISVAAIIKVPVCKINFIPLIPLIFLKNKTLIGQFHKFKAIPERDRLF